MIEWFGFGATGWRQTGFDGNIYCPVTVLLSTEEFFSCDCSWWGGDMVYWYVCYKETRRRKAQCKEGTTAGIDRNHVSLWRKRRLKTSCTRKQVSNCIKQVRQPHYTRCCELWCSCGWKWVHGTLCFSCSQAIQPQRNVLGHSNFMKLALYVCSALGIRPSAASRWILAHSWLWVFHRRSCLLRSRICEIITKQKSLRPGVSHGLLKRSRLVKVGRTWVMQNNAHLLFIIKLYI